MNGGTCENDACTCAAEFDGALCSTGKNIFCNIRLYCDFNLLFEFRDYHSTLTFLVYLVD